MSVLRKFEGLLPWRFLSRPTLSSRIMLLALSRIRGWNILGRMPDKSAGWPRPLVDTITSLISTFSTMFSPVMGCRMALRPHQRAQADFSTKVDGLELTSATVRKLAVAAGSTCEASPAVLLGLSGSLNEIFPARQPGTPLVRGLSEGAHPWVEPGVQSEASCTVVPQGMGTWALGGVGKNGSLRAPGINIFVGHDAAAARLRRNQGTFSELVSSTKFDSCTAALKALSETSRPLSMDDPWDGTGTWDLARARHRSMYNPGVLACL